MRFSWRRARVGCFLTLVAFSGLGCRKAVSDFLEKPKESAGPSDSKGTSPFRDPENAANAPARGSGQLPPDFPKSIPLYPGATITLGGSGSEDSGTMVIFVGLQTKDSPDQVAAFYRTKFGSVAGYLDTNDIANNPMAGITRVVAFKDAASGTDVGITIQRLGDDGATIQVNVTKNAE